VQYLIVNVLDPDGDDQKRLDTRSAHLAYTEERRADILTAGRLMSEDGTTILGGFFVLDVADRAAAEAFMAEEPYHVNGIWSPKVFEATALAEWSLSENGGRLKGSS